MIEITEKLFDQVYQEVKNRIESETNFPLIDFKTHPFVDEHVNYKYSIWEEARSKRVRKNEIGTGKVLQWVKEIVHVNAFYNNKQYYNNLVDGRIKNDFDKKIATHKIEDLFFEFFWSRAYKERYFNEFLKIGLHYQLIAYLFFVQEEYKFMPISQHRFYNIFKSLSIDFSVSNNVSWENYVTYNEIINSFKVHLSKYHKGITMLDAHSFLWIYGFKFDSNDIAIPTFNREIEQTKLKIKNSEIYLPKKSINKETILEDKTEIDFIEVHKGQIDIGEKAEELVKNEEIQYLYRQGQNELARKVKIVSMNLSLGFDILSYETSGEEKQIEVKAISIFNKTKSFIITKNEIMKSREYSNYYVYCVAGIESEEPEIFKLKKPDFDSKNEFLVEPLTFRVYFE